MAATEVITTVMLTDDPEWWAMDMSTKGQPGILLIQDKDANIGIMGTPDQIWRMLARISDAIAYPVKSTLFATQKEAANG